MHASTMRSRGAAGARGFTLVELMIALTLGLLILLALTVLFARNSGNQAELERTVRQLESARFALDAMTEDTMHAGYYGEFNPNTLTVPPAYQMPDPCATAAASQGWNTEVAPAVPVQIPVPIQGIAANAGAACLTDQQANTEAIVVRRADTGPAITLAQGNNTNLYIQIARCGLDTARIRAATVPSATLTLRLPDCATVNDSLRRLTQRTYYIATCNDCAAGDGIPTLKRVEMINGQLQTVSIAEGVENLQVEYGVDTNADGSPDKFVTTAGVNGVAPDQWQNVVSVRLHLLTRSTQATAGFTDARTYQLGPNVAVAAPGDGFKRTLMTTTVRLYNVGGRRE